MSIRIAGSGQPVVVLEAHFGGRKWVWKKIWRTVASFTTVCVYDRAGVGESEPGRRLRTVVRMVEDLRRLLTGCDLPPPYVPVGFSFGGLIAQVFARRHPTLVSGMVLVDLTAPDQFARLAPFLTPSAMAEAKRFLHTQNSEHVDIPRSEAQARGKAGFPRIPLIVLTARLPSRRCLPTEASFRFGEAATSSRSIGLTS